MKALAAASGLLGQAAELDRIIFSPEQRLLINALMQGCFPWVSSVGNHLAFSLSSISRFSFCCPHISKESWQSSLLNILLFIEITEREAEIGSRSAGKSWN